MDITELKRNHSDKRHPWEKVRAKIIRFFIQKYNCSCSHILDVGSGDAFVVNYLCLNQIGNQHTALDTAYTKNIIDSIRATIPCKINFLQTLPDTLSPKADCVLLLDVLEHCEDDSEILRQLNTDTLTQSPTFFITAPAFQSVFSMHDELLFHYRRYSEKQLKELCKNNNYKIISSGYFFTSLFLLRRIQLFLEKFGFRRPIKSIDNWKGSPVVSGLISFILWIDFLTGRFFTLIGIRLPGLSVYCICHPLPL